MFIKKRKITKASIDELAKRYPQDIISDEDARNIVAGAHYYSNSGNCEYLGQIGSSAEIRFIDRSTYNEICGSSGTLGAHTSEKENPIFRASSTYYTASLAVRQAVLYREAQSAFGDPFLGMEIKDGGSYDMGLNGYGQLLINASSVHMDNLNDVRSMLFHEKYHRSNGQYGNTGNVDRNDWEREAYIAQVKDTSWSNTSSDFRRHVASCMLDKKFTKEEIRRLTGISL